LSVVSCPRLSARAILYGQLITDNRQRSGLFLLLALAIAGCGGRPRTGNCKFHDAVRVIDLQHKSVSMLTVARHVTEPDALYVAIGPFQSVRVDLTTGAQTVVEREYGGMSGLDPEGWVYFKSDDPASPVAPPLIRSGMLRVAFVGSKDTRPAIGRGIRHKLVHLTSRTSYTGARVIVLGQRRLLEQDLTNFDYVPGLHHNVAVEPDGKRVACLCRDIKGTWVGVFER
jgi:hypothetical protein